MTYLDYVSAYFVIKLERFRFTLTMILGEQSFLFGFLVSGVERVQKMVIAFTASTRGSKIFLLKMDRNCRGYFCPSCVVEIDYL